MEWMVEISYKPGFFDAQAHTVQKDIEDLGISGAEKVKIAQLYRIEGSLSETELKLLCEELLADKITQQFKISHGSCVPPSKIGGQAMSHVSHDARRTTHDARVYVVEVWFKKGVTDAVADTVKKGAIDLGINGIESVKTGFEYEISGSVSAEQAERICRGLLANKVVQEYKIQCQSIKVSKCQS